MSILIKGMGMPKYCGECPILDEYGKCQVLRKITSNGKLSECPLIELPPHGRLIDADMLTTVTEMVNGEWKSYYEVFEVDDAPTIIEAEGEDG